MSELMREEEWLLVDIRPSTLNHILFWKQDRKGYTTDINKAHVFTREQAFGQHKMRDTDIPVQKAVMISMCQQAVLWESFQQWRRENANNS